MSFKNKNYSKFVATAATATLVASAVVPVVSAASFSDVADQYKEAVDYLTAEGISQGYPNGKFGTDDKIKRQDAAVMIANALGAKADGEYADAGFTDVPARSQYAVNYLVENGIVNGKEAGRFGADDFTTREEMSKIIANAYNLVGDDTNEFPFTDVSKTFKTFVDALYENGITQGKDADTFGTGNVTRGEFALFIHRAEVPQVATTEVVSVTATDAKTVEVTFNNAIDAKTLKNGTTDVITVTAKTGAAAPGTITQELSEDGKTLTLTAGDFFEGDYTVAVPFETVKGTDGEFVKPANKVVNVNDETAPVLTSASATVKSTEENVKLVTLTFNEDIKTLDNVKIAGVNYNGDALTKDGKTVTFAVDLDATKTYEVTAVNATDVVDNVKEVQTASLNVVVDNIAPSITDVVVTGEKTLTLTVDEALAADLNTTVLSGKIGTFAANVVESVTVNADNNKKYDVTLKEAYLYKNGNSDTVTLTLSAGALTDALGNTNAEVITKTAVVSKDATAPTVEKVKNIVSDGTVTGFTVSYNEEVTSVDSTKVKVVNAKGEILSFANVATAAVSSTDSKEVVFTLADVDADKYSFDFAEGFVTDKSISPNKSAANSFTVDVTNAETPVETTFNIAGAAIDKNDITVDFGAKVKATGTGSALNPASYQLNGTVLPTDTKIAFATTATGIDQSKAVITLPAGFVKANDTAAVFRVTGVQTLDNKVSNSFIKSLSVTDNTAPEAQSFVATELDTITVTYSEALLALAPLANVEDEVKLFDNKGASIAIKGSTVTNGKLVLTVEDASVVSKLNTVEAISAVTADIKDAAENVQKAGLTINK